MTIKDDGPEFNYTLLKTIHYIEMTLIATMDSFQYYNILCTHFHFELLMFRTVYKYYGCFFDAHMVYTPYQDTDFGSVFCKA